MPSWVYRPILGMSWNILIETSRLRLRGPYADTLIRRNLRHSAKLINDDIKNRKE
jgi:hypothetical protein